jgi:hypothetical protein
MYTSDKADATIVKPEARRPILMLDAERFSPNVPGEEE